MDQLVVKQGESLVEIERKGGKILSENKFFSDLCSLMKNVEFLKFYDEYPENKIHEGRFTNSQVKSGSLKRETYIKKNKGKNLTEKISSCQLDAL